MKYWCWRHGALIGAFLALVFVLPGVARAQNYPTKPIRVIVGFAAGSSGDITARIIGQGMSEQLGQSIIVENRPGASSMLASEYVARAPKDGYTLLLATVAATINTTLMAGKGPNFQKDLAPIAAVGSIPNILVVHPDVPAKNVKELIALAKSKPNELLYGASGIGSGPQMAAELFKQMADVQMGSVLYPGSAQTVTDLIAGRIQVMFSPASSVLGFIHQGMIRPLAVTQAKRMSNLPDLPTVAEEALPGYDTGVWFGMLAPAGTDQAIVDRLSGAINTALKSPNVIQQLNAQGLEPLGGSPDDFRKMIASETDRWAKVVTRMKETKQIQ